MVEIERAEARVGALRVTIGLEDAAPARTACRINWERNMLVGVEVRNDNTTGNTLTAAMQANCFSNNTQRVVSVVYKGTLQDNCYDEEVEEMGNRKMENRHQKSEK